MAIKKRNKKITYTEFLAWLGGVEDMQSDDWHPDSEQWKTIRAKLSCVVADVEEVIIQQSPGSISGTPVAFEGPMPGTPVPTRTVSTFDEQKPINRLPSAMQTSNVTGNNPSALPATKPQNIDSSNGNYESQLV